MKAMWVALFVLLACGIASATPSLTTSESYYLELVNYDSAGVTPVPPESLFIVVYDQDGDSVFTAIADTANAQCKGPYTRSYRNGVTVKTYTYFNTVGNLDGATGGAGHYTITAFIWNTTKKVSWYVSDEFYETTLGHEVVYNYVNNIRDTVNGVMDTLQLHDGWVAQQTILGNVRDTANAILDTLQLHDGWVAQQASMATAGVFNSTQRDSLLSSSRDDLSKKKITPTDTTITGKQVFAEAAPLDELVAWQGVATGTPTTTKFAATALTQGDNYWNGSLVFFKNGNAANQPRPIADFFAVGDSITITTAWTTAPAAGDSFYIVNIAAGAGGGIAAVDVWNVLWNTSFTAGSMGDSINNATVTTGNWAAGGTGLDSATTSRILGRKIWGIAAGSGSDSSTVAQRTVTGGAGLDSATTSRIIGRKVWGIAAGTGADSSTASLRGVDAQFISTDAAAADNFETMLDGTGGKQLALGQLRVVADGTTYDTAIVAIGADNGFGLFAQGAGTGEGIRGHGGATGSGIEGVGGGTSGNGINALATLNGWGFVATGVNGAGGILAQGTGTNSDGFKATSTGTGNGIYGVAAGTGDGMRVQAASGVGLNAYTASGTAAMYVLNDGGDAARFDANGTGPSYGMRVMGANDGAGMRIEAGTVGRGLWVLGSDVNEGVRISGGANGNGMAIVGGATAGNALRLQAVAGGAGLIMNGSGSNPGMVVDSGIDINGGTFGAAVGLDALGNNAGLRIAGLGSGNGMQVTAGATGNALRLIGGATSGDGVNITATIGDGIDVSGGATSGRGMSVASLANNDNAVQLQGQGTGTAIYAQGGVTGVGVYVQGGATSGDGLQITSVSGDGVQIQSNAAGDGLKSTAAAGDGMELTSTTGGVDLNATLNMDDLTGTAASTAFETGYFDAFWNRPFNTAWTAASMGDSLNNSSYVQGAASGLTATQVADTVWKSLYVARNGVAGSFADSAKGWGATSAGSLTASVIADTVWKSLMSARSGVVGSFGDSALDWGRSGGTGLDSATTSRIVGRKVWGIAAGSGADSSTIGDREVELRQVIDAALVAADFAPGFYQAVEDTIDNTHGTGSYEAAPVPADRLLATRGVASGAPGTLGFKSALLTQADDYWNGMLFEFINGSAAGQARYARDFISANDSVVVSAAFAPSPASGDSFYVWAIHEGASSLAAVDVWNVPFNTAFTAASMGDSMNNASYMQGTASGLTASQVADTVWKSLMTARNGVAGSFGDSSRFWGRTAASSLDSGIVNRIVGRSIYADQTVTSRSVLVDSLYAILDTLQLQDGWAAQQTTLTTMQTVLGNTRDTANAIMDTLQLHDGWVAQQTTLTTTQTTVGAVRDTVNATLDTLQLYDAWVAQQGTIASMQTVLNNTRDTSNAILDTLQLHDGWVAQQTILGNVRDSANAILDSMQLQDNWGARQDSLTKAMGDVRLGVIRWGGVPSGYDSTLTRYFPLGGAANKDSAQVTAWIGATPTLMYRERYMHGSVATVADSLRGRPGTGGGW